jgi:hypothetical protein
MESSCLGWQQIKAIRNGEDSVLVSKAKKPWFIPKSTRRALPHWNPRAMGAPVSGLFQMYPQYRSLWDFNGSIVPE